MFLTETNIFEVAKKQYYYKLKAYAGFLFNLIAVQILALLFSSGGVGGSSMGSNNMAYSVKWYSADMVIIFTLIWAFIIALYLTTNIYRNTDFTFVSNRLSSDLSNIAFLLTASIAGGISASLSGFLLRVIVYFTAGSQNITIQNFFVLPMELIIGIVATTLYIILFSAAGYFLGMLTKLHRFLIVLLPVLIFGTMFLEVRIQGRISAFLKVVEFFANESSFVVFLIKVILAVTIFFYGGRYIDS